MTKSAPVGKLVPMYDTRDAPAIPVQSMPRDMRPRLVDRAKVKAARAASRRNRRKR